MSDIFGRLREALADRYRLDRELGHGGMATVYLAEDLKHRRQVALKVLHPEIGRVLGSERFLREIEIAARLEHPNILTLIDSGEAAGLLYYVMPYVKGPSLRDRLAAEGALPVREAVQLLREVIDALAHAHAEGVVHRDIKPENILLSGQHAVVADFGVAKAVSMATDAARLTETGLALGTPTYMSPEQATGDERTDHRADIYAVGVLAYEMLSGRPPFEGATVQQVLAAHVGRQPDPLSRHRDAVPPALEELVMRCLAKNPADRWQRTTELLTRLDALATPTQTTPIPTAAAPVRSRPRWPVGAAAAALVAIAAGGWWFTRGEPAVALDPDVVVPIPFRVSGIPELAYLGEGIVDLIQMELTGEGGPRAVSAQSAVAAWQRAGGSAERPLSPDEVRKVAAQLGAGLVLEGSIVGSPANAVLNATLTDLTGGRPPVQARVSGSVDSIVSMVADLAGQVLSLRAGEEEQRVAVLGAVPLPALRAYLEGQAALRTGRFDEAVEGFGRALEVDSTFALAALSHSVASSWVPTSLMAPGRILATRYRDNLPARDRLLLDAWIAPDSVTSWRGWIAVTERAATVLGDRVEAWYILGDWYFHYGMTTGLSREQVYVRAWGAWERALAIDPDFGPVLAHKFDHATREGDTTWLRALADSFPQILADDPEMRLTTAILLGDSGTVSAWRADLSAMSFPDLIRSFIGVTWLGRPADAELADVEIGKRTGTDANRLRHLREARRWNWGIGRPGAAAELTRQQEREHGGFSPWDAHELVFAAMYYDGDTAQALRAVPILDELAGLEGGSDQDSLEVAYSACTLGFWEDARGDRAAATERVQTLRRLAGAGAGDRAAQYAHICGILLRGYGGDSAAAAAAAEEADRLLAPGPFLSSPGIALMNLRLSRLWDRLGRRDRALTAVQRRDDFAGPPLQIVMMRDEGLHALATGDTAAAIDRLGRYLRVRSGAEPAQREADEAIRRMLAAIAEER